jgi:hypothetical protein
VISACPDAQLSGEAWGVAAGGDGLPGARLAGASGDGAADECAGVGAPFDGVAEPRPDGSPVDPPPDDAPHAAKAITTAITQAPAHHRMFGTIPAMPGAVRRTGGHGCR